MDKVEFELVSPERLLVSKGVDMVVVPGEDGDFGVLPRHSPLISAVRPGVIRTYEGTEVAEEIFVAGGFAEVTPARCTVLAEKAMPTSDIDRGQVEQDLSDARDDLTDAKTDQESASAQRRIKIAEEMLRVSGG